MQSLRLAARAVEREHQLRTEPLAKRMHRNERVELADELGVQAEREIRLDALLDVTRRSSSNRPIAGWAKLS